MKRTLQNLGFSLLFAGLIAGCTKSRVVEENNELEKSEDPAGVSARVDQCTKDQTIAVGASYKLNNNIWGAGTSGAGSQCIWYESSNNTWGVNASHTSGSGQNIKGYPALVRGWLWYNSTGSIWASSTDNTFPVQVSQVASFTTTSSIS
ncbi:MAG TPA: hypothetical protein VGO58_08670 [Chitinophagaceae bacterium]|jgi:hypothetical protein|nr:hypothetical protein [Chitinophagaceae bacterium]